MWLKEGKIDLLVMLYSQLSVGKIVYSKWLQINITRGEECLSQFGVNACRAEKMKHKT